MNPFAPSFRFPLPQLLAALLAWVLPGPASAQMAPLAGVQGLADGRGAYACALVNGGAVMCWGANNAGQLGDGSTSNRSTPVTVPGLSTGIVAVGAGYEHACALTSTGKVLCWGANNFGQLGDGTNLARSTPRPVVGLDHDVVAIAVGDQHGCALDSVGSVLCWGANSHGQLGNGSNDPSSIPVAAGGIGGNGLAIAAGALHTCAINTSGGLYCWGANVTGQLGIGSTSFGANAPVAVNGLSSGVTAIAAGGLHTCAISTGGVPRCWGYNSTGALGDGSFTDRPSPTLVSGLSSGVAEIAGGDGHTCARLGSGALYCWGQNGHGQVGDGTSENRNVPVALSSLGNSVLGLGLGGEHSCIRVNGNTLGCWGRNDSGQLGDDTIADHATPASVLVAPPEGPIVRADVPLTGIAEVGDGVGPHSCALTRSGGVKCWGLNINGQLGDGTSENRPVAVDVIGLPSAVRKVVTGLGHTCVLTIAGAVFCWGRNDSGQLGDGSFEQRGIPTPVLGLDGGAIDLAAGNTHTCAVTSSHAARCWGFNLNGELGDGTQNLRNTPVTVSGLGSGIGAISAGINHSCALSDSHSTVYCWGNNFFGQLGNGGNANSLVPVTVSGLGTDVLAISVGEASTCAVRLGGSAWCWGNNQYGQLGDGTILPRNTPVAVSGLGSGVTEITIAGGPFACALRGDAAWCWGRNNFGQLGDGTQTERHVPVQVTDLEAGVTSIAASYFHSCAALVDGRTQCWGWNAYGQLGNGSIGTEPPVAYPVPADVLVHVANPVAGDTSLDLHFLPPPVLGASATQYRATCFPSGSAVGTHSPLHVTGLVNHAWYSCSVAAQNSAGWGPESGVSNAVEVGWFMMFADGFE